jgi:hypothetical protein
LVNLAISKMAHSGSASTAGSVVFFEGIAIPPKERPLEAALTQLADGRYWLLFGEDKLLVGKYSRDRGRSWGETTLVQEADGSPIELFRQEANVSLLRLRSADLGMVYGGPATRPGRYGTLLFRKSQDEGRSWSPAVVIDSYFAVCHIMSARVLRSGRIVAPAFNWYSPKAGEDSGQPEHSVSISWIYYSDDDGLHWKRSLSELFVSIDETRRGVYSFEEPCLEELEDGRLLMFGRTELGRFYQSNSTDGGITWSVPEPTLLAASYAPPMVTRIPATGHLLLVWNQTSTEEILAGLPRHRLSTAISKDFGMSWTHFRNLESLDDISRVVPPSPQVYRMSGVADINQSSRQPTDWNRYPHAPGFLSVSYPTVVFWRDEVAFAYLYGNGPGEMKNRFATKIKVVALDWLYELG